MEECIFKTYDDDECVGNILSENQPRKRSNRIKSIITVSKNLGGTFYETLQPLFRNNPNLKVKYDSNCANKYCSVKRKNQNQDPPSTWPNFQLPKHLYLL